MLNMAIVVICELVVAQLINQWRECLTRGPMKTTNEVVIKKIIHSERWSHQFKYFKYRTSVNDFLIFFYCNHMTLQVLLGAAIAILRTSNNDGVLIFFTLSWRRTAQDGFLRNIFGEPYFQQCTSFGWDDHNSFRILSEFGIQTLRGVLLQRRIL